ncbi:MAG: hypothetical protein ACOYJC_03950 [Christensenellales bacterium]|jgi:hypothetical protein
MSKRRSRFMNRNSFLGDDEIKSDVLGSYTGVVADDPYEIPVQDADDL